MIYFMAPTEGGNYIKIERKRGVTPRFLMKKFIEQKLEAIFVFKGDIVYDGFLLKHTGCPFRTLGEDRGLHKSLMEEDLPTEYIE